MSPNDPPPELGLPGPMREHEARLLADSMRTSRLTLLYGSAGVSRSELLAHGVVPLLGRRQVDRPERGSSGDSRAVEPLIDRRDADRQGVGALGAEQVVYFSDWGTDPLPTLLATIRAALPVDALAGTKSERLADVLEAISEQLRARLFIVLDAFEQFWATGENTPEAARFVAAFGEAVDRPHLRVNFLLAVDDRWEGRLGALRRAVRGFDDSTVRLLGFEKAGPPNLVPSGMGFTPVTSTGAPAVAAAAPAHLPTLSDEVRNPPPVFTPETASPLPLPRPRRERPPKAAVAPPAPIRPDGVYAFIESTLTQTADVSEPWHDVEALPPTTSSGSHGTRGDVSLPKASPNGTPAADPSKAVPSKAEPPSPIDEWIDSAIDWCRRLLQPR